MVLTKKGEDKMRKIKGKKVLNSILRFLMLMVFISVVMAVRVMAEEILFSDDFEKGDTWELVVKTDEKAEQTWVTTPIHNGKYALKSHLINGENCGFHKTLPLEIVVEENTTLSFWYYVPSTEPVGGIIVRVRGMGMEFHDFGIKDGSGKGDIRLDKWNFISLNLTKDLKPSLATGDIINCIEIGMPNSTPGNATLIIDDVVLENK